MQHLLTVYNGQLVPNDQALFSAQNDSLFMGNSVHQCGIIHRGKWLFWEEVYFNLMASMRKMRMPIPMNYTLDYFQKIVNPHISPILHYSYEIFVFPDTEGISMLIKIQNQESVDKSGYYRFEIDVFKDIKIYPNFITASHAPKPENIVAHQFRKDNDWDDVLFLNDQSSVARTINGNIYFFIDGQWVSNSPQQGAYRQSIDQIFQSLYTINRRSFSAFELQKAEEVMILSEKYGVLPITQFRKKTYPIALSLEIENKLIQ